jgi:hypothetical protein
MSRTVAILRSRKHAAYYYNLNIRYFEFVLAYDTMLRVWNTYLVETNKNKMLPFRKVVTSDNDYYNLYYY